MRKRLQHVTQQARHHASLGLGAGQYHALRLATRSASGLTPKVYTHAMGACAYLWRQGRTKAALPLLGLHGFAGDKETWLLAAMHLPKARTLAFVDLPGHGDSTLPNAALSIRQYANVVREFAAAQGLDRVVLCGNSMGGGIALRLAHDHPELVAGVVLLGSVHDEIHHNQIARAWLDGDNPLIPHPDTIDAFVDTVMSQTRGLPKAAVRYAAHTRARVRPKLQRLFADFITNDGAAEGVPALASIAAPCLILHGERDQIIDRSIALHLARKLPAGQLRLLPGVGHAPQLEAPRLTARLIEQFALRLDAAATRPGSGAVTK